MQAERLKDAFRQFENKKKHMERSAVNGLNCVDVFGRVSLRSFMRT